MLKRFLLFAFLDYYPQGGWCDFRGSFDTPEAAVEHFAMLDLSRDNGQVVDGQTGEIVRSL